MASVLSGQARPPALSTPAVRQLVQRNTYLAVPLALLIVLFIANAIVQPQFLSQQSWAASMAVLCPIVLTAMAMTLPILSGNGGIDLSVGPLAGFITVLIAAVLVPAGITSPLIIPIVIVFGLLSGALNGVLIAYVRLPAIIATLGMYLFYQGLGTEVLPEAGGSVPVWLVKLDGSYGPIPAVWVVFAVIAVVWLLLTRGSYLRNLLSVGGDERAAFTAGVNVSPAAGGHLLARRGPGGYRRPDAHRPHPGRRRHGRPALHDQRDHRGRPRRHRPGGRPGRPARRRARRGGAVPDPGAAHRREGVGVRGQRC